MAIKIYTRVGDKGATSLLGGTKVPKSHLRIEAYGTLDELNAHIGLCRDLLTDEDIRAQLLVIQDRLFIMGSQLACDPENLPAMQLPELTEADIETLEKQIDKMEEVLPAMKNFILPGGQVTVSQLHIARCIGRRAERHCVRLHETGGEVAPLILKYLNRLSDYLFVLARYVGHQDQVPEIPWKPRS